MTHYSIAKILDSIGKTDARYEREQLLEKALWTFQADPLEAENLLVHLMGRLVEDEELAVYTQNLRKALERYHRSLPPDAGDLEDEAYSLMRARED